MFVERNHLQPGFERRFSRWAACALAMALSFSIPTRAHEFTKPAEGPENEVPASLKDIGIDTHVGEKIDLDQKFVDHDGRTVTLRDYTKDGKPLLLSLAYYSCPSLCNFHLNGVNAALKQMKQPLGQEFNFVIISFDPKEKPALANAKRESYLKEYGRPAGAVGWHFLTGEQPAIDSITKSIGFKYRWDEAQKQYAHASAAYAIAPDGTISRYLFGIVFDPRTIRLSMIEASNGRLGDVVDKLTLLCFRHDPKAGKYVLAAANMMRAGGVLIMLVIGAFVLPFWFRKREEEQIEGEVR